MSFNIVLTGQPGAGKTTFIHRLITQEIIIDPKSSKGNEDYVLTLQTNDGPRNLNIWVLNPGCTWEDERFNNINGFLVFVDNFMMNEDRFTNKKTDLERVNNFKNLSSLNHLHNDPVYQKILSLPNFNIIPKKVFITKSGPVEVPVRVNGYFDTKNTTNWTIEYLVFIFKELLADIEDNKNLRPQNILYSQKE